MDKHCSCCKDIGHRGSKPVPYCRGGDFIFCTLQCKYFAKLGRSCLQRFEHLCWTNQVIKAIEQQKINRCDVLFRFASSVNSVFVPQKTRSSNETLCRSSGYLACYPTSTTFSVLSLHETFRRFSLHGFLIQWSKENRRCFHQS